MSKLTQDCPICGAANAALALCVREKPIYRCSACDVLFRPTSSQTRDDLTSTQLGAFGDKYVRSRKSIAPWLRADARRVLHGIGKYRKPPARLLEIGCSTGELCTSARALGYDAEGLELSAAAARFAREQYGLRVFTADIETFLHGQELTYDVIAAIHTLEHFPEPTQAVRQIYKLLRPGGYLFIEVPSAASWDYRLRGERARMFTDEHLFFHTPRSIRILFEGAGFRVADVTTNEGYRGLFNGALELCRVHELASCIVRQLRAGTPQNRQQNAASSVSLRPASSREALVDVGRSAIVGLGVVSGLALSPVRWALERAGLGGAVRAVGYRPLHDDFAGASGGPG